MYVPYTGVGNMKRIVAPIIIGILVVLYTIAVYVGLTLISGLNIIVFIIGCIVVVITTSMIIYVTCQRIKEIRSGEEDDLSKY